MIADELAMSKETVRNILLQDLGIRKLAAKLMLQNSKEEQMSHFVQGLCRSTSRKQSSGSCHHW
jgi:hypothetical protein